jgi:hypothetical protein
MRRLPIALALLLVAASAFAIDTRTAGPLRIGILEGSDRTFSPHEAEVAELVRGSIRNALRDRGFDAFTTRDRYDDLRDASVADRADYWIEIAASRGESSPIAGVALPVGPNVGMEWELIVNRVAAEVRLFNGRNLDQVKTFDLRQRSTTVAPSAVFVARSVWAAVALPVWQWTRYRGAIRQLGSEAASRIADELER